MITGFHAAFGITCEAVRQVMFGGQPTTVPRPCKEWLYDFHRVKSGPGPECAKSPNASARMNRPGFLILAPSPHFNTTLCKFNRIA